MQIDQEQVATGSATSVIEGHSYDYVPVSERHGKPRSRSSSHLEFGASAHVLIVVTGASGIAARPRLR